MKKKFFITILISLFVSGFSLSAQTKMVISTGENTSITRIGETLLRQAYESLGMEMEMAYYPELRSLYYANNGTVDGELMRIKEVGEEYGDLIMIPVSLLFIEGVVFSLNPDLPVEGFESLRPYMIAVQRGIKFIEYNTMGMRRIIADDIGHAFRLLKENRVDVVLTSRIEGLDHLIAEGYEGIVINGPPVIRIELYHFLHRKHEKIVPEITRVLEEMKQEGEFIRIREQYINEMFGTADISAE